jgi:hypothetical protein
VNQQCIVTIYGMLDATLYDNVATASLQAVNLGATVVSRGAAPHITATFSRMVDACVFMTWLSQSAVVFHTVQLTQTSELLATPWPFRDAERVKAGCIQLARDYNTYAKQHRMHLVQQDAATLIAEAIAHTPLLSLSQEGYHP